LKQLKSSTGYERIYEVAFTTLAAINTLEELSDIKAMKGYSVAIASVSAITVLE